MPESIPNCVPGSLPANTLPLSQTSAYVREAKPSEFPALAAVYTRAFARDPMMNWLGRVRALVPADHKGDDDEDARVRRTLAGVRHFQFVLVKMAKFLGPIVVVVEKGGKGEGEGEEQERIVGGALWMKPGEKINPSPLRLIRVSPWKSIRSWGFGVLKRSMFDFTPKADKMHNRAFAARGMKRLDSWRLLEIAIDPTCEGKGYCSLLMRDGFQRASAKPVYLESSTPRSRDIYAHLGFEVDNEHRFGVGSVDEMGIAAKGDAAVGWPCSIMTKWENP